MQTKIWTSSLQTMGFVIHEQPSGEWCACFCSIWSQLVIIITWNLNELPYKIIYHSDWWCDIGRPSDFLSNLIMYPFSMKCEIKGRCLLPLRRPWRDEESPWINTYVKHLVSKLRRVIIWYEIFCKVKANEFHPNAGDQMCIIGCASIPIPSCHKFHDCLRGSMTRMRGNKQSGGPQILKEKRKIKN